MKLHAVTRCNCTICYTVECFQLLSIGGNLVGNYHDSDIAASMLSMSISMCGTSVVSIEASYIADIMPVRLCNKKRIIENLL